MLDFSEWQRPQEEAKEAAEEVLEGEMPAAGILREPSVDPQGIDAVCQNQDSTGLWMLHMTHGAASRIGRMAHARGLPVL